MQLEQPLYAQSARAGNHWACNRLATMHELGRGTPPDPRRAFHYWTLAAAQVLRAALTARVSFGIELEELMRFIWTGLHPKGGKPRRGVVPCNARASWHRPTCGAAARRRLLSDFHTARICSFWVRRGGAGTAEI